MNFLRSVAFACVAEIPSQSIKKNRETGSVSHMFSKESFRFLLHQMFRVSFSFRTQTGNQRRFLITKLHDTPASDSSNHSP